MQSYQSKRRGFSLIELVIVVVIIAIIAAIAVPKMSRGAAGANDAALMQDLSQMRSAIDTFAAEHGGAWPSNTTATIFTNQMVQFTDASGAVSATKTGNYIYGPYLKAIPTLPVGTNKGLATVTIAGPAGTGSFAWFYDGQGGIFCNNPTADADALNKPYNTY